MTETQRQEKPRQNARDALLEAGSRLFIERSYSAVSTRDIAEAAGVNLGAIQYYFGSKAKLFLAAVEYSMHQGGSPRCLPDSVTPPKTSDEAVVWVATFIAEVIKDMLCPEHPPMCRVMYREIHSTNENEPGLISALVEMIVREYSLPTEAMLIPALALLRPEDSQGSLNDSVTSIIGLCAFYVTHRPFLEKMRGANLADPKQLASVVRHTASFGLRGLGCSEKTIAKALQSNAFSRAIASIRRVTA